MQSYIGDTTLAMSGLDTLRTDGFLAQLIVDCNVMSLVDANQEKHSQSVDVTISAKIEKCADGQQGNLAKAVQKSVVALQSALSAGQ